MMAAPGDTTERARRLANEMARHIIGENDPTGAEEACQRCVHIAERALTATEDGARRAAFDAIYGRIETFIAGALSGGLTDRANTVHELLNALKSVERVFDPDLRTLATAATKTPDEGQNTR